MIRPVVGLGIIRGLHDQTNVLVVDRSALCAVSYHVFVMSVIAKSPENDAHVLNQSGGYVKRLCKNRRELQEFLETGRITGQGGLARALRQWRAKIRKGDWAAIKLAIEYGCGRPSQFHEHENEMLQPGEDFNFYDGVIERIEQQIKQVTTRVRRP